MSPTARPGDVDGGDPLTGLQDDLAAQRDFMAARRVTVYVRLLERLSALLAAAPDGPIADRLRAAWSGRAFDAWYERPLLLLAALRADALRLGPSHPLWRSIAADEPVTADVTDDALGVALDAGCGPLWRDLARRYVQTNETARAVAWMWPAALIAAVDPDRPVRLFDVGTSGGLNLIADRLPPVWQDTAGRPLAVSPLPPIVQRTGYDLRPLDVTDDADARWLRACIWPGQHERVTRLDAGIAAFRDAGPERPAIGTATASSVPGRLPRADHGDPRVIVFQTVMRDYLPAAEREAYDTGMRDWLLSCDAAAAVWIELEIEAGAREGGPAAGLYAHVAGGTQRTFRLASCEPHPAVLDIDGDAVAAFRSLVRAGPRD